MSYALAVSLTWAVLTTFEGSEANAQWTQFGGPNQDFKVDDAGLAKEWPSTGPPELWRRGLGKGYSAIVAERGRLYTMYRADDKEFVVGMDAASGRTLWESAYPATPAKGHESEYGDGPNATPLVTDGRLYTIGVAGALHCFEAETGRVLWSQDLLRTFGGNVPGFGYSSSPIEYGETVIALVGGEGQSIIAFDKKDGRVVWKSLDFRNSFSTPLIVRLLGEEQLVAFMETEVIGVDPADGTLLWQYPSVNHWKQNISMPVPVDERTLFISSLKAGTRSLEFVKRDGLFTVKELWSTSKMEVMYTSIVRIQDHVYGSSGFKSAPLLSAVNVYTGEIAWRERGFARANIVGVGARLIILDENGILALTTATPERLTIHSEYQLLEAPAWTAPTIVGTTLYARDTKCVVAVDLR